MDVAWTPSEDYVERANVTRFMRAHGIETYDELLRRSTADIAWFWDAVVHDLDIAFYQPYSQWSTSRAARSGRLGSPVSKVNLAHQCVDRWAAETPDAVAAIWEGEDGEVRRATYQELRAMSDRLAGGLRSLGVAAGDTVGIFLPMAIETVAAVMACAKLGAVFVPIFSGFGPDAVATRLVDAGARVLITANASLRKGAVVPMKEIADQAADEAGSVEHVVVWIGFPMCRPRGRPATSTGMSSSPARRRRSRPNGSTPSIPCSSATRVGRRGGEGCSPRARAVSS